MSDYHQQLAYAAHHYFRTYEAPKYVREYQKEAEHLFVQWVFKNMTLDQLLLLEKQNDIPPESTRGCSIVAGWLI